MLAVFTLYLLVNVAVFFFLAIIAQDYSPEPAQLGLMFSVLKWLGGGAALVAAIIGDKAGVRRPHLIAFLILIAGVAVMAAAQSFTVFMIGSWVWEFGFTLGCIYATAAISRGDSSGKLVTLVPAAFGVSMLAGGFIGGQLLQGGSPVPLYVVVAVLSVLPFLFSKRVTS
jgi:MFS family permease